jgi:ribonuclease I
LFVGDFSFYVYAQSWSAGWCKTHSTLPGCSNPTDYQRKNVTVSEK